MTRAARNRAAPPIDRGGRIIESVPLLTDQAGTSPDMVLVWNDMPAGVRTLDLALHLHGYSENGPRMNITSEKLPISGLDFSDPEREPGTTAGRSRPTLGILPRGHYFGGRTGFGYNFPVLVAPPGTWRVIDWARHRFGEDMPVGQPRIGRRILTAHSGGGAALAAVTAQFMPNEVYVFDGLYSPAPALIEWAERAIARDATVLRRAPGASTAAYMETWGSALRVFYIPETGTEPASLAVAEAVSRALAQAGPAGSQLAPWYRVEPVDVAHLEMPRVLGWQLLADAGAPVIVAPR